MGKTKFKNLFIMTLLGLTPVSCTTAVKNKTFTVTFNANGGKFNDGSEVFSVEIAKGDYVKGNLFDLENSNGKYFNGWIKDNEYFYFEDTPIKEDINVYAQWEDFAYDYVVLNKSESSNLEACITGFSYEGSNDKEIIIPKYLEGAKIVQIGSHLNIPDNFTGITLPDSVTSIGPYAFENASGLKKVIMLDSVKRIREGAFCNCKSLEQITIPSNVKEIEAYTFQGCESLSTVVLPKELKKIGLQAFDECKSLEFIDFPESLECIGMEAFRNCESLDNFRLLNSEINLDPNSLYGTKYLKDRTAENKIVINNGVLLDGMACEGDVVIPDGVKTIASFAFASNKRIKTVTIPDSVVSIQFGAFYNCEKLTEINLPDSLNILGEKAFYQCESLKEITIPDGIKILEPEVFGACTSLENANIPQSVVNIEEGAFTFCKLDSVEIPQSVKTIGRFAFSGNLGLSSVILPNCLESIGEKAFGKTNITDIEIPDTVKFIGEGAFEDTPFIEKIRQENPLVILNNILIDGKECTGDVTIPYSLRSIADNAFENCENITSIKIPNSVLEIGEKAFYGCSNLSNINIPKSVKRIGADAFLNTPWLNSMIEENSLVIVNKILVNGFYFEGNLDIPDTIEIIADKAFEWNERLLSVSIPKSVKEIGKNAFNGCNKLKSIVIPDSVEKIGFHAFESTAIYCRVKSELPDWDNEWVYYKSCPSLIWNYRG